MLTDLLQAGHEGADVRIEEKNSAMQDLLAGYGVACFRHADLGGSIQALSSRTKVLEGADLVIYAGDPMASSRFQQDRDALSGVEEGDEGLLDQARVNGGIGGLMHTLRQGASIVPLAHDMKSVCPDARVISLGDPVARTTDMFARLGFESYGLARSCLRGPTGLEGICRKLDMKMEDVRAVWAGLPGFSFLTSLQDLSGRSLMSEVYALASDGVLGRLIQRWYRLYDAVAIGRVTDHAEYMPAQDDFKPEERPEMGESVEKRKDRILNMNLVREHGLEDPDGMTAQLLLLTRTPPQRPIQLGLALLRGEDLNVPDVTRKNAGILALSRDAEISAPLILKQGKAVPSPVQLPGALLDLMGDIAWAHSLASQAALGDRAALRECVETDPALDGLDRLYVQDVVQAMIRMHSDILGDLFEDPDDDGDME